MRISDWSSDVCSSDLEAMVNYLALLGWGPKDGVEVRPLAEIVELFRLEDVTSSPAFFDVKKLQAFNSAHVRALPVDQFVDRARPFLSHRAVSSDEHRVGKEIVSKGRYRWAPYH